MRSNVRAQTLALLKGSPKQAAITWSSNPAHQASDSNKTDEKGTQVRARPQHCTTYCALGHSLSGLEAIQSKPLI